MHDGWKVEKDLYSTTVGNVHVRVLHGGYGMDVFDVEVVTGDVRLYLRMRPSQAEKIIATAPAALAAGKLRWPLALAEQHVAGGRSFQEGQEVRVLRGMTEPTRAKVMRVVGPKRLLVQKEFTNGKQNKPQYVNADECLV